MKRRRLRSQANRKTKSRQPRQKKRAFRLSRGTKRRAQIKRNKSSNKRSHKTLRTNSARTSRKSSYKSSRKSSSKSSRARTRSRSGSENYSAYLKSLSIIITVHNEESSIRNVLNLAMKLKPMEIIIVENGSTDRTLEICKEYPVRCYSYPFRLGHDVGRAIGASAAAGDVLLFIDGDIEVRPSELLPFIKACYNGTDIALNNLDTFYTNPFVTDSVSTGKYFLNCLMSRQDLGFCSLTAIPHAMTKAAALAIGIENLAVPPKAHAIALFQKLNMQKVATVDVFRTNKFRSYHLEVGEMILGDHIEAIHWLQEKISSRVNF